MLFALFRYSRVKCYAEQKKKSIDKVKANSYHVFNARFSNIKFVKSKLYLPVTDSIFLLELENGPILYI